MKLGERSCSWSSKDSDAKLTSRSAGSNCEVSMKGKLVSDDSTLVTPLSESVDALRSNLGRKGRGGWDGREWGGGDEGVAMDGSTTLEL